MNYRWIILHKNGAIGGTNSPSLVEAYLADPDYRVIDTVYSTVNGWTISEAWGKE